MASINLADAHVVLQNSWPLIKHDFELAHPGRTAIITCTFRSVEEQQELYKLGREQQADGTWVIVDHSIVVTDCDGVHTLSNHNHYPARALDFAIMIYGKINWNPTEYKPVGELGEKYKLIWGGRWKPPTVVDNPHLELRKEIP